MKIGEALKQLETGATMSRRGWNGKNQYVTLAHMDSCTLADGTIIIDPTHLNIGSKFLLFVGTSGYQCGWLASQADLLADDWEVNNLGKEK